MPCSAGREERDHFGDILRWRDFPERKCSDRRRGERVVGEVRGDPSWCNGVRTDSVAPATAGHASGECQDRALCGAVGQVLGVVTAVSRSTGHVDDRTTAMVAEVRDRISGEVGWGYELQRKVVRPSASRAGVVVDRRGDPGRPRC
jgi:hypothetical protein